MNRCALDASAILAVFRGEPGANMVKQHLQGSLASSINIAEVLCISSESGGNPEFVREMLIGFGVREIPFDAEQADIVASIYDRTLGSSVGLADRACLAVAIKFGIPALTADHAWLAHDVGVEVELIRGQASRLH